MMATQRSRMYHVFQLSTQDLTFFNSPCIFENQKQINGSRENIENVRLTDLDEKIE